MKPTSDEWIQVFFTRTCIVYFSKNRDKYLLINYAIHPIVRPYARASTLIVLADPHHQPKKQIKVSLLLYKQGNGGTEGLNSDSSVSLLTKDM